MANMARRIAENHHFGLATFPLVARLCHQQACAERTPRSLGGPVITMIEDVTASFGTVNSLERPPHHFFFGNSMQFTICDKEHHRNLTLLYYIVSQLPGMIMKDLWTCLLLERPVCWLV